MAFDPKAYAAGSNTAPEAETQPAAFDPKAYAASAKTPITEDAPLTDRMGEFFDAAVDNAPNTGRKILRQAGNIAGGINTAILDVADLPSNLINAALQLAGTDNRVYKPSDIPLFAQAKTRTVPKGESAVADALRTGAEWGGTALAPSKLAYKLPDILAGTGAALGEAVGGETGKMMGGMAGALSPAGVKGVKSLMAKQDPNAEAALRFLQHNLTNEGKAVENIKSGLARGEDGTLSDLSRDPQLAAVETATMRDANMREALLPVQRRRESQIAGQYDEALVPEAKTAPETVMKGRLKQAKAAISDAKAAQEARLQGRTAAEIQESQARQAQAVQADEAARVQAEQADLAVGGTGRTDKSSAALAEEYDNVEAYLRNNLEGPAWKEFEANSSMDATQLKQDVADIVSGLPDAERADLLSQYKKVTKHIMGMDAKANPQDVQYVLSTLKQINNEAKLSGNYGALNKRLGDIGKIIDTRMRTDPTDVGKTFRDAMEATVTKKRMLGGRQMDKARRSEPELMAGSAGFKGDKGAATIRRMKDSNDPALMQRAEDYVRDAIRKEGVTDKTLVEYAPVLDEMPTLKGQVQAAVDAKSTSLDVAAQSKTTVASEKAAQAENTTKLNKALTAVGKKATDRQGRVKGLTLSKYAGKPKAYISSMLSAADDTGELGTVYNRLKREGAGDAFKSQVMDTLKDDVLKIDDVAAKDGVELFNRLDRLEANGVIGKQDVQQITDIIALSEGRKLRRAGGKVNTPNAVNEMMNDAASTMMTLPLLSAMPSSHQLMAAGMLKRNFKRLLRSKDNDPAVMAELEKMMKDPSQFVKAMEGKLTVDTNPKEMDQLFFRTMSAMSHSIAE